MEMIQNVARPKNRAIDLDFKIDGPALYTHVDLKSPINFKMLETEGIDMSHFPSLDIVAYNIGLDIPKQKQDFCGLPEGPFSPENVLHIVNFEKIPYAQKAKLKENLIEGAGGSDGIQFLNDE